MKGIRTLHVLLATTAIGAAGAAHAQVPGVSREEMWYAPTAEDWARPCLIQWQRSFDDALAVAEETGNPILICVNMDGEIASEHYAGIRYRDPDIAQLYQPYVAVVASVYRHTPRDYDENGDRIPCPRFGTVTCGEHIAIEPILYEQYFDGERVAPRHIMIELDRAETYDVYYAFDTQSVFDRVERGITERERPVTIVVRGDRPVLDRVDSRDSEDQAAVESAYRDGDRETRRTLLRRAREAGDGAPVDMLRMAVFGFDVELSAMARETLANSNSVAAVELINEALRVPMKAEEREALIAALERIGEQSERARTLAVVHRGLQRDSSALDVDGWASELSGADAAAAANALPGRDDLESSLEAQYEVSRSRGEDASAALDVAETALALALDPETAASLAADRRSGAKYARLMFEDARKGAERAVELGATGWRVAAVRAIAEYNLGNVPKAQELAEVAVRALPAGEPSWNAMAVLTLFAQGRQDRIRAAAIAKEEWPPEWLTDVNAAYSVLAKHPLGTDFQVAAHVDFLTALGAASQATRALDDGLARFPDSWALHGRLRAQVLAAKGAQGLAAAYATMLAEEGASPNLEWYAGFASLVAAEFHRRAGEETEARAAYDHAIELYEQGIAKNPTSKESADHYVALALAGRARIALAERRYELAVDELLASFERREEAAASLDGLGMSPVTTAQTLIGTVAGTEHEHLAVRVRSVLDALPPHLLAPPEFERESRGRGPVGFDRRDGGRGGRRPGSR